ncbi:MAG: ketoacyl-ACP synthase III [Myxococcales bacterium]|nr:ketoacyl-ACP synthase III [Myxococcales bacterium]MCB9581404.1 ketoacyl-ACP synthase III [Polyangiaceae bacterium]
MSSGLTIVGSGHHLPGRPITNHDLARVMDTNDEWIRQRTGIAQRHFCPEGQGVSDLALPAAQKALEGAGRSAEDIDYILFNTMTPDHMFPGSAPLLAEQLGCRGVPALDLRVQCAAMVYSFQLADSLVKSGAARSVLIVGAEAHAGFMPWRDWEVVEGKSQRAVPQEDWERATRHRSLAIIFGDGAGALLLEAGSSPRSGILAVDVHSDGRHTDKLLIPAGFRTRPFISETTVAEDSWIPRMEGREVFRRAVTLLPKSVRAACAKAKVKLDDIDWFIAHQANQRINDAVRERLGVPEEKVPSNIERLGNTSAATIPILVDEMRRDGRLRPGQLVCFLALGAGLHWGSVIWRV